MKRYHAIITGLFGIFIYCCAAALSFAGPENVQLRGLIVDIAAKPISGAEVYAYDSLQVKRPADFISPKTSEDGKYQLTLPSGSYWVVAVVRSSEARFGPLAVGDRHSGEPQLIDFSRKTSVEKDFTVMDLREAARLGRKRSEELLTIQGRIVDEEGKPVPMAYVMADKNRTRSVVVPPYLSAWTDDDGVYTLYLPAGRYYLGVTDVMPPPSTELERFEEISRDLTGYDLVLSTKR